MCLKYYKSCFILCGVYNGCSHWGYFKTSAFWKFVIGTCNTPLLSYLCWRWRASFRMGELKMNFIKGFYCERLLRCFSTLANFCEETWKVCWAIEKLEKFGYMVASFSPATDRMILFDYLSFLFLIFCQVLQLLTISDTVFNGFRGACFFSCSTF